MVEKQVLETLAQRVPVRFEELGRAAWELFGGDEAEVSPEAYGAAARALRARGLIAVLSKEALAACAREPIPTIPDVPPFAPGDADFTEAGYRALRRVWFEEHGPERVAETESGWIVDRRAARVEVYAPTERAVRIRTREVEDAIDDIFGAGAEIVGTGEPGRIGPWRPFRFFTLGSGFRQLVRVRTPAP